MNYENQVCIQKLILYLEIPFKNLNIISIHILVLCFGHFFVRFEKKSHAVLVHSLFEWEININ